ncbi:unnamed protein product [Onchocerca flexuosa]|uniref:Uncharacterized protein n=1 Tax=Onchocerca flexuosa TaxID=387005 RepID=A0A183HLM5_9BILA|nr:unnamed protein product [Onchocerca flexuosa]
MLERWQIVSFSGKKVISLMNEYLMILSFNS